MIVIGLVVVLLGMLFSVTVGALVDGPTGSLIAVGLFLIGIAHIGRATSQP